MRAKRASFIRQRRITKGGRKDTDAANLSVQVFRALIALTTAYNLEAKQLDTINTFINSAMDQEVYCEFPPGYEYIGPPYYYIELYMDYVGHQSYSIMN